jgi:hypothetical protein
MELGCDFIRDDLRQRPFVDKELADNQIGQLVGSRNLGLATGKEVDKMHQNPLRPQRVASQMRLGRFQTRGQGGGLQWGVDNPSGRRWHSE